MTYSITIWCILPVALAVFVIHTISYIICDNMSKRDGESTVSSTYMIFIRVRFSIKGRILFYWVVVHTLQRIIQVLYIDKVYTNCLITY